MIVRQGLVLVGLVVGLLALCEAQRYGSRRLSSGSGGSGGGGGGGNGAGGGSGGGGVDTSCPQARSPRCEAVPPQWRPIDGSCHKPDRVLGMSGTPYTRIRAPDYADGVHAPRMSVTRAHLPSPREIVNRLHLDVDVPNPVVNHFFMNWGQLVAHDITLLDSAFPDANSQCCAETLRSALRATDSCARIDIPNNDPFFRRFGVTCLGMGRSNGDRCQQRHFEQRNMVTHFVDASFIYGSDQNTASRLRAFRGGLLASRNINGEEHLPVDDQGTLLAGDGRVTVTAMLSATQTVFMREHNRIARALQSLNPQWDDERLYQEARRITIAEWQSITYRDWLPWLIGREAVDRNNLRPAQSGYGSAYSQQIDPRTANDFAAAAFRTFHSLIQNNIWLGRNGRSQGSVVDVPADIVLQQGMLQGVVEGMLYQPSQEQDQWTADEIKNRMFHNGRGFGGDLISADIMRGREHGIPSYNQYRATCGLGRASNWAGYSDLISARNIQNLQSLYASFEDVDAYVGALLERRYDTAPTASITSPVFQCIVVDQFRRWRFGDPYFFDFSGPGRPFTPAQLQEIRKQTASKIMCDNIRGLRVVPRDAFLKNGVLGNSDVQCSQLPGMDLSAWRDQPAAQQQQQRPRSQPQQQQRRRWNNWWG